MKNLLFIALSALFIIACNGKDPNSLDAKKELLKQKKQALSTLKDEVAALESEILKLDPPKEKKPILVNVSVLEPSTFQRFIDIQANVESDEVVNLTSEMPGRLTTLKVKEGDQVRRGQLIARVDSETMENQIIELETALSLAQTVYERQERLWKQEIGSEIQYLQAKNNKERLEKNLQTVKSQIAKANIYAPISGVIDQKFMNPGELASPGIPIVSILDTRNVIISADVPETYLPVIKKGQTVEIYFPALDKSLTKRITMVGRTIDPANRTFTIEIETTNKNGLLKPNLLAEVRFNDYTKEDAIIAPVDYIMEEVNGKKYAFVSKDIDGKMVAEKRYIALGESYDGMSIITEGLSSGDQLITEGSRNINDTDPIIISNL